MVGRYFAVMPFSEIESLLESAVDSGALPGVVAIVTGKDRILYECSYGAVFFTQVPPFYDEARLDTYQRFEKCVYGAKSS